MLAAHFPPPDAPIDALNRFATPSQQRLIFEEAFLFQMGVLARRQSAAAEHKPVAIHVDDRIRASARAVLPFRLTGGQRQALKEIVGDLQKPHPMNRLLQGDVGRNTISLKLDGKPLKSLLAGDYTFVIADRSATQNFHLKGPGENRKTGVAAKARAIWTVTLTPGKYTYRSDKSRRLHGTFTVRAAG